MLGGDLRVFCVAARRATSPACGSWSNRCPRSRPAGSTCARLSFIGLPSRSILPVQTDMSTKETNSPLRQRPLDTRVESFVADGNCILQFGILKKPVLQCSGVDTEAVRYLGLRSATLRQELRCPRKCLWVVFRRCTTGWHNFIAARGSRSDPFDHNTTCLMVWCGTDGVGKARVAEDRRKLKPTEAGPTGLDVGDLLKS
jgi:hypothetical protein